MEKDYVGCDGFEPAVYAGHVKPYPKEPKSGSVEGKPVSYFIGILSGLAKTPKDYLTNPTVAVVLIGLGIIDPDDGKVWDWYCVACPTGPPCKFLEELFYQDRKSD